MIPSGGDNHYKTPKKGKQAMTKTYFIKYELLGEIHFDKVVHKSIEDRPRWHKVEALSKWKETHKGYGWMRINNVFTKEEMKANGYL